MKYNIGEVIKMKLIKRPYYLESLINVKDIPDIKIVTGVRRSGKSKLLDVFYDFLIKDEKKKNVIRIKLNLKANEKLLNPDKLYKFIDESYIEGVPNYLIIDEVQQCAGFERVINSLYEEERFDMYLSGSNAFMLSSDLVTLFGGRYFDLKMYPFSFREFNIYYDKGNPIDSFDDYVAKGGMSGSYLYRNQQDAYSYINGIYKKTISKDIVERFRIENEPLLIMVADFLMDNIGNKTSIRNIANSLTSNSYKTNDKTVGSYVDYLCKSFLFYPFTRYDIKGTKFLESDKKYYLADLSFRFANLGTKNMDYGRLYENLVAIELLRRGYEVYVGVLYEKEIDFVAMKDGYKYYIQVSDDVSREDTFKREVEPLLKIKDAYPKMLIARTKHPESQYEGIRIVDIGEWLNGAK